MEKESERLAEQIVRALAIKGLAPIDGLAAAVLSDPEHVQPVLNRLIRSGQLERVSNAFRLTKEGKAAARGLLVADRSRWGTKNAVAALDAFHALDQLVKETITAWQLKDVGGTQVANDHTDRIYDARVMARLSALHEDTSAWMDSLAGAPSSLRDYLTRLERALQSARQDPRFMASPMVDSYHGVWFELHEALILLAGRKRAEESAAGRA